VFQAQAQRLAVRGGSWNNHEDNARVSIRNNNHPNNRNNNIGFRVAAFHRFAFSAGSAD
jgi:formylglycine-generating enzyme required for sulfatase activity